MTSENLTAMPSGFAAPSGSEPSTDISVPLPLSEKSLSMAAPVETYPTSREVLIVIDFLKKQVATKRTVSIKKKVEENKKKLGAITSDLFKSSTERRNSMVGNDDISVNLLLKKQKDALYMQNDLYTRNGSKDVNSSQENSQNASEILLVGANIPVRNPVLAVKIREVKRVPPYTTWIFLHRNQRMTEDQSVVGRRRIYYDQSGGEALICSDSEEEVVEDDEEKKEFVESEDYILRMTIKELGFSDVVVELLAQCFGRKACEVKARFEILTNGERGDEDVCQSGNLFLDKDVDAALDSFDNLFCRRCLVFDCKLHGCSQDLVFPAEKQQQWNYPQEETVACGLHCYRLALRSEHIAPVCSPASSDSAKVQIPAMNNSNPLVRSKSMSSQSESTSNARNISEGSDPEIRPRDASMSIHPSPSSLKSKIVMKDVVPKRNSKRVADRILAHMMKKQKKLPAVYSDCAASVGFFPRDGRLKYDAPLETEDSQLSQKKAKYPLENKNPNDKKSVLGEASDGPSNVMINDPLVSSTENMLEKQHADESICKQELLDCKSWKNIEKSLFEKGVDIFGRNSCLIARNLMMGMKTCFEVFQYMNFSTNLLGQTDGSNSLIDPFSKCNENMGTEVRRSKFLRRRGKVRRLKYTWKSAGYHSIRKRISERKDLPCRQFNPCSCESGCGKQCSCLLSGTCCEKYCGCPKSCKNRFRGCHCAKSQCRSRQCPCFAADRECDPDVCRNCWVSCGDGTLGVPSQRGDNYECRNMKLLLKQQQRVLLGRSDVSGWGAFLKNSVAKNEYLGEYTGELISHREADKRGKIYDRENSSFLFNLNDQFVLDAFRKGDKLKFANHSPDPNCYAKVMMVAGDHRVGIFAKERINSGEELFYDYRYEADRAPAWARKPEASGIRKDDCTPSTGRAKKVA